MESETRDAGRRRIVIAASLTVGAMLLVAAIARLPELAGTVRQGGVGPGVQPPFHLDDRTATIQWVATPVNTTSAGCLFGLRITWLDPPADDRDLGFIGWQVPKLVYAFVDPGATLRGSFGPHHWSAGTYQFTTEGSCGWQAIVEPTGAFDPSPSPDSPRLAGATR